MPDLVSLRDAASVEEEWMFALYRRVFGEHISRIWGWNEERQAADFQKGFAQFHCQIIELDGQRIGFVRSAGEAALDLQLLALAPEHQRRGLGTALIRSLQSSCAHIELKVFVTNVLARRFYLRLGFDEIASDSEFYSMLWRRNSAS